MFAEEKGLNFFSTAGSTIQNGIQCLEICLHNNKGITLLAGWYHSRTKIRTVGSIELLLYDQGKNTQLVETVN